MMLYVTLLLQAGRSDVLYTSTFDCWKKIVAKEGSSALFKGSLSNVFRGVGGAMVLVMYDEFKKIM